MRVSADMKMTFDIGDSRNAAKLSVLLDNQVQKASKAVELCETSTERFLFDGSRITRDEYLCWARDDLAFYTQLRAQFDEQFATAS
jgi:hypothetical protein